MDIKIKSHESEKMSDELYRSLINRIQAAVIVHGKDTEIIAGNPKAQELLGLSEDQMLGKKSIDPVWKFLRSTGEEMLHKEYPVNHVIANKAIVKDLTVGVCRADKNDIVWVLVYAEPVLNSIKKIEQVIVTFVDITEQKKATFALKESELRFRSLFETMAQGVVYQDVHGHIISVNPAAEQILGLSADQMQGKTSVDSDWHTIHEDGSNFSGETHPSMIALREGKPIRNIMMGVYNPNLQNYKWISVSAIPQFRDGEKIPFQVFTTFEDLTNRKKIEKNLRESEEKFSKMFHSSPSPMILSEIKSGLVVDVNESFTALTLYRKDELIGSSVLDLDIWANKRDRIKYVKKMKEELSIRNYEIQLKTKRGDHLFTLISGEIVKIGSVEYLFSAGTDITELIRAEEALTESENRYRLLFESNPHPMWVYDLENLKFLAINEAAVRHYGYTREEFSVMSIKDIRPDSDIPALLENVSKISEGIDEAGIWQHKKKDGTIIDVKITSHTLLWSGRHAEVVLAHDVTVQKKAEEELIEAKKIAENSEKLKTEFLAQMSHEIRTPINAILSFSHLLKDDISKLNPEEMESSFNIMDNAGKRIIRTIDLILNMSEVQTGTYKLTFTKCDLFTDILIPLSTQHEQICKSKGIELVIDKNIGKLFVEVDEYTVTQIFDNLLGNAVKYTKEGKIEIIGKHKKNKIYIDVIDTGVGISEEYLPNLFLPFSQEEQGYTRKFEGAGLGLALVKEYCELNNAKIYCESKKGKGSKFTIIFSVQD